MSRVWSSLEFKINLGDYENVVVHVGASAPCENTPEARRQASRALLAANRKLVEQEAEKVKSLWANDS